jgi:hypothetical protein
VLGTYLDADLERDYGSVLLTEPTFAKGKGRPEAGPQPSPWEPLFMAPFPPFPGDIWMGQSGERPAQSV